MAAGQSLVCLLFAVFPKEEHGVGTLFSISEDLAGGTALGVNAAHLVTIAQPSSGSSLNT
jgi:hypothetical protein